jgi:hypothetical protein
MMYLVSDMFPVLQGSGTSSRARKLDTIASGYDATQITQISYYLVERLVKG